MHPRPTKRQWDVCDGSDTTGCMGSKTRGCLLAGHACGGGERALAHEGVSVGEDGCTIASLLAHAPRRVLGAATCYT